MKKISTLNWLIACFFILSVLAVQAQPASFMHTPENPLRFQVFQGTMQLDGFPLVPGDWVAAFDSNGNLAGAGEVTAGPPAGLVVILVYEDDNGSGAPNLPDGGMNAGETFTLQYWQAATGTFFDPVENVANMQSVFGPWDPVNNFGLLSDDAIVYNADDPLLPIELAFFKGKRKGTDTQLEWATFTETNNKFFSIERSRDNKDFVTIGTIDGAGFSQNTNYYEWMDENPLRGDNYYQLRQTDFDGANTISDVIVVQHESASEELLAYPNPVREQLNVVVPESLQGSDIEIELLDMQGRVLQRMKSSDTVLELNMRTFSPGVYALRLLENDEVLTTTTVMVKQ